MSKKNINKISVHKADYHRVILTETLPYEVPFIFSNEGFYKHIKLYEECSTYPLKTIYYNLLVDKVKRNWTVPLTFKIRKNNDSLRKLSLIHPYSQINIIELYKTYGGLICYYCTKSEVTLRSPAKIATSFYKNNRFVNINKYKPDSVETTKNENLVKHATSYFAYNGYSKLHKFITSDTYIELEKKYNCLWMIDIFKCFDSIYTHTISWALKNKNFSKDTVTIKSTFGQYFDSVMQQCNHSETNGILIGPEVSRIFAEIIFQDIDNKVIQGCATKHTYKYNKQYCIRRYVDDYFVYAADEVVAQNVVNEITDQLSKYNLYINSKKLEKYTRPFYTKTSQVINEINKEINTFSDKFIIRDENNKIVTHTPIAIRNVNSLKIGFINNIKAICMSVETNYSTAAGYIISSIFNNILRLIEYDFSALDKTAAVETNYRNAFIVMLEVAFYFYSVEPTVGSSYSLGKCIILTSRFFAKEFQNSSAVINHRILDLSLRFMEGYQLINESLREGLVPLEKLNVILAISELGDDYLIPSDFATSIFKTCSMDNTYHEIMVCLFYIKDHAVYKNIKSDLISQIKSKTKNAIDAKCDSETLYTILDSLTCPFLDKQVRLDILKNYYSAYESNIPGKVKLNEIIDYFSNNYWFIKWQNVDLMNSLEKKMLNSVY